MMKRTILATLVVCALGLFRSLWAVDIENASSGAVVPGEWNTNFAAAKAYAEENGVPFLVLWSSPGCGFCNKMKSACNAEEFVKWRKEKKIVLAVSEGEATAKAFTKNSTGKFPYMRLYWPAGNVDVKFSGRSSYIPASGSTLGGALINYLDSLLVKWSPDGKLLPGGDDPEEPAEDNTPGPEWKKARKLYGTILDESGAIMGRLVVNAGRMNARRSVAKVKVQVQGLDGKVKTLGSKEFKVGKTTTGKVSSSIGSADLIIKDSALSGSASFKGVACTVSSRAPGGAVADGTLYFNLEEAPASCRGYPVFDEFLPIPQYFTSAGSKWSFQKKPTLKYDVQKAAFVMSSTENPSGLKLSYTSSTGYFKGAFSAYAQSGEKSKKEYKASVGGFMVGGTGSGVATIKNVGSFACTISPKVASER